MSTLLCEKDIYAFKDYRETFIDTLRAALNAAESGQEEVTISFQGAEVTWNFEDNEFFVVG